MKTIYIILLFVILALSSCKSKSSVSHWSGEVRNTELSESNKETSDKDQIKFTKVVEENDSITTVTETEETFTPVINPVSGEVVAVPKTRKTNKTETRVRSKKDDVIVEDESENTTKDSTLDTIEDATKIEDKKEVKSNDSTAPVKYFYLVFGVFGIAFFTIKRFFPSIFVKLSKTFKL